MEIGDLNVQCLLYADYVVSISETTEDMQIMFNALQVMSGP